MNSLIHNLPINLHTGSFGKQIVSHLVQQINKSPNVKPNTKQNINKYFDMQSGGFSTKNLSADNLLQMTLIYALTNLNRYDFKLINLMADILEAPDIISLLLLNNIADIKIFCLKKHIYGDVSYNIETLKKLSVLHNLESNF
jgi:hypothetical protein